MFDIGFAELLIIGVVGLLVIGPERLPTAIRTVSLYLNRLRRGFNDIKREVQQELHNDAVMQQLRETGEKLRQDTESIGRDLGESGGRPGRDAKSGAPAAQGATETNSREPTPPGEPLSGEPSSREPSSTEPSPRKPGSE